MGPIKEGQVIQITKEHLNRVIEGTRIHPLRAALYAATGGEIELEELPDGSMKTVHINGDLYILCDRIQRWLKAFKALDSRVSPIAMKLLITEDGEFIFNMNYDHHFNKGDS